MKTVKIENWRVVPCKVDAFRAPEMRDHNHLVGDVAGRPRGPVYTTRIISAVGRTVRTLNTAYVLGAPSVEYLAWLAEQGIAMDEAQPVKVAEKLTTLFHPGVVTKIQDLALAPKQYPMLMRPEMVRATLKNLKTVTRRLDERWSRAQPGDLVWVKETWAVDESLDEVRPSDLDEAVDVEFLADGKRSRNRKSFDRGRTRVSIHMPRVLARLWLEVLSVRQERLSEMVEEEAFLEGVEPVEPFHEGGRAFFGVAGMPKTKQSSPLAAFRALWDSIHGKGDARWAYNPLVVRVEFKRVARP